MKWLSAGAAALGVWLGASAAQAADYDTSTFVVLDGYVKSVDWSGRDLKVVFHSNDGYGGADWTLQGPAVAGLKAMGWKADTVKAGDRMDAIVNADKGGAAEGKVLRFILDDYRTLETGLNGASLMYPKGAIKKTIADPALDPLATAYTNTLSCTGSDNKPADAPHSCRLWINADHTLRIVKKTTFDGLNPDGSFNLGAENGLWWLQTQRGKQVLCTLLDNASRPQCHTPVARHKVGDTWTVTLDGATGQWTETWTLISGRSK